MTQAPLMWITHYYNGIMIAFDLPCDMWQGSSLQSCISSDP